MAQEWPQGKKRTMKSAYESRAVVCEGTIYHIRRAFVRSAKHSRLVDSRNLKGRNLNITLFTYALPFAASAACNQMLARLWGERGEEIILCTYKFFLRSRASSLSKFISSACHFGE